MIFERRQYERFDFSKDIIIAAENPLEKKEVQFHAKTLNLSRGGMLICTIAQFKPKTRCWVQFKSNSFKSIEAKGNILRVVEENRPQSIKANEILYALEFEKVFSEFEIEEMLKKISDAVKKP